MVPSSEKETRSAPPGEGAVEAQDRQGLPYCLRQPRWAALLLNQAIRDNDLKTIRECLRVPQHVVFPHEGVYPLVHATALALQYPLSTELKVVDLLIQRGGWRDLPTDVRATWLLAMVKDPGQPDLPRPLPIGATARLGELVQRLQPEGVNVNGQDAQGEHALFEAVRQGDVRWTSALLKVGVDPTQPRHDGVHAHELACDRPERFESATWRALLGQMQSQVRLKALEKAPTGTGPGTRRWRA